MEHLEPTVAQHGETSVAVPESVPAKMEITDHNSQSTLANSGIMDAPVAQSSIDSTRPSDIAHAVPLQNGASEPGHEDIVPLVGHVGSPVPPPSEVPSISALVNDPKEPIPSAESTDVLSVAQTFTDPVVQAEMSSVRSTTPQPVSAPEVQEPPPNMEPIKEPSPVAEPTLNINTTTQALTPPEDNFVSKPSPPTTVTITEPQPSEVLPHRSPAAAVTITDNASPTPILSEQPSHQAVTEASLPPATIVATESNDQLMADAPASPSKNVRSREEEDLDEPATKRLKADDGIDAAMDSRMSDAPPAAQETAEAEPKPQTPVTTETSTVVEPLATAETTAQAEGSTPGEPVPTVENQTTSIAQSMVPRTHNSDYDKPITAAQKKVLPKIITNVKRGTHAVAFKEPVDPVQLGIPTYFDVVKNPMDLSTIEKKIKADEYSNVNEFLADFDQIVKNCEMFNGPAHSITQKGYEMRHSFDKQISQIPSSEFIEPPPPEKRGARRTSAEAPRQPRRESRSSLGNAKSPTAASPASPAFALQPSGIPVIRRDSTVGDGRPRREIHPPAPKDLPYSAQKPKKKKFLWELKFAQDIVSEFKKPKYQGSSWPFLLPVDPVAMNIPTYHKVIKKPMDLSTLEQKLKMGQYENLKEFETDMRLIFANCYKFNVSGDSVYKAGQSLERLFDDKLETKKQWIKDHAPSSSVVSPESSADESDNDEEDEDDDDEEEEKDRSSKIADIQTQMQLMAKQLAELQKGSDDNAAKKKARGKSGAAKTKDSKKKTSKPDKKLSSGASKSKKPKEQPYVTYEQKQDISDRINSLPPDRMNQALKLIRENMPNLKGAQEDEIELDIDELPNDVLHKLLNFVRKYAPRAEDQLEAKRESKPAASSKPKKNKPMGKIEQEARIREIREKLHGGASDESGGAVAADESSGDDDDSEESEED